MMAQAARQHGIGTRTAHDPGDPLVTSHCPFCGSGQVVGRSDGTISCDFCGQNYIVRVQPAFPGMPQMPGGPGAPSDVGPDGGLLDPSMIGPDGLPAGGMPPGGEEGDEGAPPPGGDDGEDGPPPEEDDGGKKKPPPKGKKEGSYRGLQGQLLTEGQLVRHLAAHASGHDPRVLSALRREAAARGDTGFLAKMGDMAHDSPFYEPTDWRHYNRMKHQRYDAIRSARLPRTEAVEEAVRQRTGIQVGGGGEKPGSYGRLDSGHALHVHLDYPKERWYGILSTPAWPGGFGANNDPMRREHLYLDLGHKDEDVPQAIGHRLGHPEVQEWLRATSGAPKGNDDPWSQRCEYGDDW